MTPDGGAAAHASAAPRVAAGRAASPAVTGTDPVSRPLVDVVVVTYNSASLLPPFLASLPDAMATSGWRLTVVDNASTDDTLAVVRRLAPDATIIRMPANVGYAAAINAATAPGNGHGPVLVLNPDVRLEPGSVDALREVLDADPRIGVAVPRLLEADGRLAHSLRRRPTLLRLLGETVLGGERAGRATAWGELISRDAEYERSCTADWAVGAMMLISRACLDQVGPWDESFFLYSEETDFALRARDAGFTLTYVPSAAAIHIGGDSPSSPRLWSLLTVNRVRLYGRRHGWVATALFWFVLFVNECTRAMLGRERSRAAAAALLALAMRRDPAPWVRDARRPLPSEGSTP